MRKLSLRSISQTLLGGVIWYMIILFVVVPDSSGNLMEVIQPTPAPRTVYFKLPLEQTKYHWVFDERATFLAGTLTLRIHGAEGEELVTVFENGKISEDWVEIGCKGEASSDEIYFGFSSCRKFMIANRDRVDMFLQLPQSVNGGGPHSKGVLPAGEYRASNRFKVYSSDSDTAFLREKKWTPQWTLVLSQETGWMEEREGEVEAAAAATK